MTLSVRVRLRFANKPDQLLPSQDDRLEAIQDHEEKLHETHPQVAAERQLLRQKNHDSRYPHLKPRTPWELERDKRDPTSQAYLRGESSFMNASAPLDPLPPQPEVQEPQQSGSSSRRVRPAVSEFLFRQARLTPIVPQRGFNFFRLKKKGGEEDHSLAKDAGEGSYRRAKRYFGEEYL